MPSSRLLSVAVAVVASLCAAKAAAIPVDMIHSVVAGDTLAAQPPAVEAAVPSDPTLPAPASVVAPSDPPPGTPGVAGIVAAVPEPAIAALMALGFAGIGWITRRRQRDDSTGPVAHEHPAERSSADGAMTHGDGRGPAERPN